MIHTFVGNLGHFFVILSFVTALVATVAYLNVSLAATDHPSLDQGPLAQWRRLARGSFYLHAVAVTGVVASLFYIVYNHYFEYHYAWSHSSRALPTHFMISSFWEGQEGSFLLWLFWDALLAIVLINTNRKWEAPVMTVFGLVQAFLASMILGVVFFEKYKLGSSPFLLLREALPDTPIFATDPNFIPKDGNGLNPLLQNYWMVIHPPTLFLGYATTLVPFAYAMAGLWRKDPIDWMRPALPWALFSAVVLGVGILMGGYWAYETLNFGGYWNWDPVENSVFVPWLTLVAAIHMMLIGRKNSTGLKAALILNITTFLLILYSTFVTRSGILGNASVHSFTDLGLSGQLLLYLLAFLFLSVGLLVVRWKTLPKDEQEASTYSREFWMFLGAVVLTLAGFQVIATTSIPVYNAVLEQFGIVSNLALPADQVGHYNKFQIWFFAAVAVLTGIGQYVWWRKIKDQATFSSLMTPLLITLGFSAALIISGKLTNPSYMVLLTAAVFAIVANGSILWGVVRGNYKLSGGAVSHIGVAMMLIGVLFSSGFSRVVSINGTGLLISRSEDFTKNDNKENKENVILWYNQPQQMSGYLLTYKGQRIEAREVPGYLPKDWVEVIEGDFHGVALRDIEKDGKVYYKKGDTLALYPENTYFEVEYRQPDGKIFTLYPRSQVNQKMGLLSSPDIKRDVNRDLYTYVSSIPDPESEGSWSQPETHSVMMKDTFFVNDYVAILDNVVRTTQVDGTDLGPTDAAIKANIRVLDKDREYTLSPAFVIKDRMVGRIPETSQELGLRIQLNEIDPRTGQFTFQTNTTQRDYIVMKAMEKPLINLLWLGTLVLVVGFSMSTVRRYREFTQLRNQGKA